MSRSDSGREDTIIYKVVKNKEEQYSIWPEYKEVPRGWVYTGKSGLKAECLAYIKEVWTDMRPLSLRKRMEERAKNPPSPEPKNTNTPREKTLVDRLCEGNQPVELSLRPDRNVKLFKEAVDLNYLHIRFTKTKGGTELGVQLDRGASDFSNADFETGKGSAHIEGHLVLDYVNVKCIADIDLSTLAGTGSLAKVESAS